MSGAGLCLFGAAPDTGNLGVSALAYATIAGMLEQDPHATITVFDHGSGVRPFDALGDGRVKLCGARHSRRWYDPASLWNIRLSAKLGGGGNPAARMIRNARACLDISGGDSFTDLYGPWRFRSITLPKLTVIENRVPLILLPQTYGPFHHEDNRRIAERIVRQSSMAWARDERSYATLRELAGDSFDPALHRCGVDVAFLLPARHNPQAALPDRLQQWFESPEPGAPLAGVNVSGLLHNSPDVARSRYEFIADYALLIQQLVEGLVERGARVVLVPHVLTPTGHYESDLDAARAVVAAMPPGARERVVVAPAYEDPREIKWLIGQLDWFCGTRMHSTIASLSQGIPTAAVAYSIKTQGVFESCGQGEHVVDPRREHTRELLEALLRSFDNRDQARASLEESLPAVLETASAQLHAIARTALAGSDSPLRATGS